MTEPILVTGGTGTLGRPVVRGLVGAGRPVRVLSRKPQPDEAGVSYLVGDLAADSSDTGREGALDEALAEALTGVRTVVHLAGGPKGDELLAARLVQAVSGRIDHLVHISVVGADQVPARSKVDRAMFGYFEAQAKAEQIVVDSGLGWTILRAAQFHQLVLPVVRGLSRLPVVPVPHFSAQPVEAGEVAARMVELALGEPAGRVPDLVGPRTRTLRELVQAYLARTGGRRLLTSMPMPGAAARAYAAGANLAGPEATRGVLTWEEFLDEQLGAIAR